MNEYRAYVAEAIATFALVFVGAGSILADSTAHFGLIGIALAHGLVLMCMIYATAHISGAHINPAVTIGMWATRRISLLNALAYILSQLSGAAVAGLLLKIIFTGTPDALALGTPMLGSSVSFIKGIIVEAILTFLIVFTIFGVAVDKRAPQGMYGVAIGLVLTFDILTGGVLTGASMNPARTFGPAIASGYWTNHAVYWIGPVIGSLVAAIVYTVLLEKRPKK